MVCDGRMKAQILERPVSLRRLRRSRLGSCDYAVGRPAFLLRPPRERAPALPGGRWRTDPGRTSFHERLTASLPQRRDARLRGAGRDRGSLPAYSYPHNEACSVALVRRALHWLARYCTLPSVSCNAGLSSALPLCNKPSHALPRRCRCGRRGGS